VRSKFLEYDSVVSSLLKPSDGVLVISLGSDTLELGAVGQGRTQQARIVDGLRYLRDGVNVVAGVVVDPAQENGGVVFASALAMARAAFDKVTLYALRAKTVAIAELVFGADFKTRTTPTGAPMYERHGGEWVAAYVDPTIARMIGDNRGAVRLCLKSAAGEYCGACHVSGEKGSIRITQPNAAPKPTSSRRRRTARRAARTSSTRSA